MLRAAHSSCRKYARGEAAPAGGGRQPPLASYRPAGRRSIISCRRNGNLSITAFNSRTSRGAGRRCLISPSLSMIASMKPRGRSLWRNLLSDARSVSITTTTSRSNRSPARASISRIWWMKAGSLGVSAMTATIRHCHRNSAGSTCAASRMRSPSGATSSAGGTAASRPGAVVSATSTGTASEAIKGAAVAKGRVRGRATASRIGFIGKVMGPPVVTDIGKNGRKTPAGTMNVPRSAPVPRPESQGIMA